MPGSPAPDVDPRYVAARRVLLNALEALAPHRRAIVVVGAQAIYLQTGSTDIDLGLAPFTTDGDLAVDPSLLGDAPQLESAMVAAGFHLSSQPGGHIEPGIWVASTHAGDEQILVPVDLIVPDGVAPSGGRRGARLGGHGKRAARRSVGLEAALIDNSTMHLAALEEGDTRVVEALVAAPAALFIAKVHKISERVASGKVDRVSDKDAADVVRLMQATSAAEVGASLAALRSSEVAGEVADVAVGNMSELFGRRGRPGVQMATRAMRLVMPAERVEVLILSYAQELLAAAGSV